MQETGGQKRRNNLHRSPLGPKNERFGKSGEMKGGGKKTVENWGDWGSSRVSYRVGNRKWAAHAEEDKSARQMPFTTR